MAEVPLLVDGALEPAGVERLERHLSTCPECRSRREFLQRLKDVVRSAAEGERLDDDSRQRILQGLRKRSAGRGLPRRRLAAAAVLVLALAGAGLLLRPAPPTVASLPGGWSGAALALHHEDCWAVPAGPSIARGVTEWVRSHPGASDALPALPSGASRYDLRVCASEEGGRALHALWLVPAEDGREPYRVSVFAWRDEAGPDAPAQILEPGRRGVSEVLARRAGWTLVLVSEAPRDLLVRLASAPPS